MDDGPCSYNNMAGKLSFGLYAMSGACPLHIILSSLLQLP